VRVHIRCIERVFVYKVRAAGCASASCLALYGNSVFVFVSVSVLVSASISASVSVTAAVSHFHSPVAPTGRLCQRQRAPCVLARALSRLSARLSIRPSVATHRHMYLSSKTLLPILRTSPVMTHSASRRLETIGADPKLHAAGCRHRRTRRWLDALAGGGGGRIAIFTATAGLDSAAAVRHPSLACRDTKHGKRETRQARNTAS
jgi:hypothetical protein